MMNEEFVLIASAVEFFYYSYIQKFPDDNYKQQKIITLKKLFNYKDIPFTPKFKEEINSI